MQIDPLKSLEYAVHLVFVSLFHALEGSLLLFFQFPVSSHFKIN